jgi:hypothetical protein
MVWATGSSTSQLANSFGPSMSLSTSPNLHMHLQHHPSPLALLKPLRPMVSSQGGHQCQSHVCGHHALRSPYQYPFHGLARQCKGRQQRTCSTIGHWPC